MPDLGPWNWTAIAAYLALAVSVLPPIVRWAWREFRPASVLVSTEDTLGLAHHHGRIYIVLHLRIENTGHRPVSIAKVDCAVHRVATGESSAARTLWRLPARTYFAESGVHGTAPRLFIGTIRVSPGEVWQEVVLGYGPRSEVEEEEAQDIDDRIAKFIGEKLDERAIAGINDQTPVEVDEELVLEARRFFDRMFDLIRGQYEIYIAALDRNGDVLGATKLEFVIYENMINLLRSVTDDYRYGGPPPYRRAFVQPRLTLVGSSLEDIRAYRALPR